MSASAGTSPQSVRSSHDGELIEAGTVLSVEDKRRLASTAARMATRAGELSEPFSNRPVSRHQDIDVLPFLARRTRVALLWDDTDGLLAAQHDFRQLWRSTAKSSEEQIASALKQAELPTPVTENFCGVCLHRHGHEQKKDQRPVDLLRGTLKFCRCS